jgi:hypothetical protein
MASFHHFDGAICAVAMAIYSVGAGNSRIFTHNKAESDNLRTKNTYEVEEGVKYMFRSRYPDLVWVNR